MTIQHPIEDEVTQLARRVEKARGRLAYQFDPALTEALSEEELLAERELAEKIRGQDRGQRWKEAQAAASAADRARQTTEAIEKADMRDLLVARKAIAAQRRESSPHAKLASLYRHRAWSLRALAGVVGAGMLWSAVNVQHNIAPGGPGDPLYWFSYLLEGMISVCLIIIMIGTNKVAEWGVVDNRKQVVAAEVALLSLTVTLNTYPYLRAEHWYDAAVHAVAPVMIGVALLIHDAASARYGLAIHRATDQVRDLPDPAEQIRRTLPTIASYRMRRSAAEVMASNSMAELTLEPEPDPLAELDAAPVGEPIVDPEIEDAPAVVITDEDDAVAPETPAPVRSAFRSAAPAPSAKVMAAATLGADLDAKSETRSDAKSENGSGTAKSTEEPAAKSKPAVNGEKAAEADAKPVTPVNGAAAKAATTNGVADKVAAKPTTAATKPVTPTIKSTPQPAPAKTAKPATPTADKLTVSSASAATAAIKRTPADEKPTTPTDTKSEPPTPEIHDTGQFRIAEILEQELAELQAARRRARTSRKTSTPAAGRDR
ncbi:hypothetical protein DFR70_109107 [Nocardia tenerifensis]|uniref:Uncharacterized protein n=1 Tax=Nocardia tenerifensis TaxID=228006 RepID=A0A318K0R7_9NOCA|nr:hypothetical protein [Nocardia tenerifensis]PXX60916.1 hypothetical protein DFR70_109107 [Nocardia tenerifensis]